MTVSHNEASSIHPSSFPPKYSIPFNSSIASIISWFNTNAFFTLSHTSQCFEQSRRAHHHSMQLFQHILFRGFKRYKIKDEGMKERLKLIPISIFVHFMQVRLIFPLSCFILFLFLDWKKLNKKMIRFLAVASFLIIVGCTKARQLVIQVRGWWWCTLLVIIPNPISCWSLSNLFLLPSSPFALICTWFTLF